MSGYSVHTVKNPGDLCFDERGGLLIVGADGRCRPHEQSHRREARERAEALRVRRPVLSLFTRRTA